MRTTPIERYRIKKLPEVEVAKSLMAEAMTWSVMKWLREKKKVRKTADLANAVLDQLSRDIQQAWTEDLRSAYQTLCARAGTPESVDRRPSRKGGSGSDTDSWALAQQMKQADDEAAQARFDAERTFDEAEKKLSTRLAREGCLKAIRSWELKEKALLKAEEAICASKA